MADLTGVPVSPGIGAGPVRRLVQPERPRPGPPRAQGAPHDERARALDALDAVAAELARRAARSSTPEASEVLGAQVLMARDPELRYAVAERTAAGDAADTAIEAAFAVHRGLLAAAGGYLAARVADLDDLRDRAVAHLHGHPMPTVPESAEPFVLVARDLAPADTALLVPGTVLALVTEEGGPTSHTAIIARTMGVPAVVACTEAAGLADGARVLVDGTAGTVRRDPDVREVARALRARAAREAALAAVTGPGRTRDGHLVPLLANIGGPRDLPAALAHGAEGVGLYRTELLFLDRSAAPAADEQRAAYRAVLDAFPRGRVVVRVLDAGADKPLGFLPPPGAEPNPALGERGLRMLELHPDVLDDQLTALAAAARDAAAELWVMAPMVTDAADARRFAAACAAAGLTAPGVMVEVPAAALRARDLAAEVAFLSIGTNDLAQYAYAADRQIAALAHLQDPWQPAILDLVAIAAEAAAAAGKECGVCGEAAADPALACVLTGLGTTSLSMSSPAIPAVRAALAAHTLDACRAAARAARAATTPEAARAAARTHLTALPGLGL